jgi:hypothetical protein
MRRGSHQRDHLEGSDDRDQCCFLRLSISFAVVSRVGLFQRKHEYRERVVVEMWEDGT